MKRRPLNLIQSDFGAELCEASLNRIADHYLNSGFAILTSWRGDVDEKTNKKNLAKLKQELRKQGYGFVPIRGIWDEEGGPGPQAEPSLFVPGKRKNKEANMKQFRRFVVGLGKKYNQDAVVWARDKNRIEVVDTKHKVGHPQFTLSKFRPKAVGEIYSKLRGKKGAFTFEDKQFRGWFFDAPPMTQMEAFVRRGQGEAFFVSRDIV